MKRLWFLIVVAICYWGCKKDNAEPEAPVVEFGRFIHVSQDANGKDLLIDAVIHFSDKNGDIGRVQNEKEDPCGHNIYDLYMFYEEKKADGSYYPLKFKGDDTLWDASCNYTVVDDSIQLSFPRALTYIEPAGNNKSIDGEVSYRMDYDAALVALKPVGRFRIYMKDRAGNKSNEIYSEDLVLSQ